MSAPATVHSSTASPSAVHDLKTLVLSRHPAIVVESPEEERVDALLRGVATDLQLPLYNWTITRGLSRVGSPNGAAAGLYDSEDPLKALANAAAITFDALFCLKDLAPHLGSPVASRTLRELAAGFASPRRLSTLVLTGARVELPAELDEVAVRFPLPLPAWEEYRRAIVSLVEQLESAGRTRVAIGSSDLDELARAASGLTLNQARQAVAQAALEDGQLSVEDLAAVVELKARRLAEDGVLELFPAADNRTELGGFGLLKSWLERARVGFGAEAQEIGLAPPRGVMLVGVQGAGKSLSAKFIAREWRLPLLKLDAGRLYDKFIGESERNFRRATDLAESMAPCVLWIDEIEKGLAPSGGDSDSGLSRRMFGSFLTWLQEKRADVFVVATANDLSLLPPELLRKGRFDEIFFVDLPSAAERETIFRIHLNLRKQAPESFDLPRLAAAAEGFSGAEIEQAVVSSLYGALAGRRALDTDLLMREIEATVPLSVTRREDIEALRATARGRFVPVA